MACRWHLGFCQSASHGHAAASKLRTDLHRAETLICQLAHLGGAEYDFGTAPDAAFLPCSFEASGDSFGNADSLLLRNRRQNADHRVTEDAARIEKHASGMN